MVRIKRLWLASVVLATISLLVGVERLGELALTAHDPLWAATELQCRNGDCEWVVDPFALPGCSVEQVPLAERPRLAAAVIARAESPVGHRLLFAAALARTLPSVALFWTLGLALVTLGRTAGTDPSAIRWLRRAATSAALLALAKPLADSLQATAVAPAITGTDGWRFFIVGSDVPLDLLLAGTAWVAAWAIELGLRARAELTEYV